MIDRGKVRLGGISNNYRDRDLDVRSARHHPEVTWALLRSDQGAAESVICHARTGPVQGPTTTDGQGQEDLRWNGPGRAEAATWTRTAVGDRRSGPER